MKNKKYKLLIIKPQIVSVLETHKALRYFRFTYPAAEITLIANLFKQDYEALSKTRYIDRDIFYCPEGDKLTFLKTIKLIFKVRPMRFDSTVVLVSEPVPHRYKKAKLIAIFSGAKKKSQYFIKEKIEESFILNDSKRYFLELKDLFKDRIKLRVDFPAPFKREVLKPHRKDLFCRHQPIYLALFSTSSNTSRLKNANQYILRITKDTDNPVELEVVIDIYLANSHLPKHYAYFIKRVLINSERNLEIKVEYDWADSAVFYIDGSSCNADIIWKGNIREFKQFYSIQAILYDIRHRELDKLQIFQKLER
jgi:hypothetical protein